MIQFKGKISDIRDETHDVKTFKVKSPTNLDFTPGQFCLVSFVNEERFKDKKKPFTLANSPTQKDYIDLTIKKLGSFTSVLFSLEVEDYLKIRAPFGRHLNFDESVKDDIVFIAGGTGITPFMSAIRYSCAKNLPNKFILLNSNLTVNDIIYREELKLINNEYDNIKVINTLVDEIPPEWTEERGLIDKDMILKYVNNPLDYLWYICGPPLMVEAMELILEEIDVSKNRRKIDPWETPAKSMNK